MSILKISLGEKKDKKLLVPKNIEPVKNIVKLAIFSILGEFIKNSVCLDLFAGSGNLGFTALSLGAKDCTFVENSPEAVDCIRKNALDLGFENKSHIMQERIESFLSSPHKIKYNILFMDPPYKLTIDNNAKKLLNCISGKGVIVYLHHKNTEVKIDGFSVVKQRFYGKTGLSLLKKAKDAI